MSEQNTETTVICATIAAVIAILAASITVGYADAQEAEVAKVAACVSNGGSWVAGPSGFECVQGVPGGVDR